MPIQLPPAPSRSDLSLVVKWLEDVKRALESAFNFGADGLLLKKLYTAPAKPREGLIAFASGIPNPGLNESVGWDPLGTGVNPGDNKGIYCFYNSTWNRLG